MPLVFSFDAFISIGTSIERNLRVHGNQDDTLDGVHIHVHVTVAIMMPSPWLWTIDERCTRQTDGRKDIQSDSVSLRYKQVLTSYLLQANEPPWTSYFVKYASVVNDQRGMSHFNWPAGSSNYHVLRTGCFPYIKYHCTRRPRRDLGGEDKFFKAIKLLNLGIQAFAYHLHLKGERARRVLIRRCPSAIKVYFVSLILISSA